VKKACYQLPPSNGAGLGILVACVSWSIQEGSRGLLGWDVGELATDQASNVPEKNVLGVGIYLFCSRNFINDPTVGCLTETLSSPATGTLLYLASHKSRYNG
jgi:hypothetical protein